MTNTPEVVVVGSLNRDYVCRVRELPVPGQTVLGDDVAVGSGGKGANQAAAAGRVGVRTAMVGRVGDDEDGRALRADLEAAGVDTSYVAALDDVRTGTAYILVDDAGENSIVVSPGANARLSAEEAVAAVRDLLTPSGVLVTQAEVPTDTLLAAITTASETGGRAVVNLAPFQPLPDAQLAVCDPLVVNASEAGALLGVDITDVAAATRAASSLTARCRSVVITLGGLGAVLATGETVEHVPAEEVRVVDTTGAGDAFTGVLAACLSRGADLAEAVRLGVRAGSYAVGRPGAQSSFPDAGRLGADAAALEPH